jgi:hypothetical protein
MKVLHQVAAAAVGAAALMTAAPAFAAVVYSLNDFQTTFTPQLGTVTVSGQGGDALSFDVSLANNVFFQQLGNGNLHDALWFDLTGLVGGSAVTYDITSPNADGASPGGDFGDGGKFSGAAPRSDAFGQGFLKGGDYAVQDQDTSKPIDFYTGHLTFTVTGGVGSHLDLGQLGATGDFLGADLRECATPACGSVLATGPVGARLTAMVPEPATWTMMILGFGAIGALARRRHRSRIPAALA